VTRLAQVRHAAGACRRIRPSPGSGGRAGPESSAHRDLARTSNREEQSRADHLYEARGQPGEDFGKTPRPAPLAPVAQRIERRVSKSGRRRFESCLGHDSSLRYLRLVASLPCLLLYLTHAPRGAGVLGAVARSSRLVRSSWAGSTASWR
jgi:hypothetical protein